MKKISHIAIAISIILFSVSCDKQLEVSPKSSITVASMWENPEDAMGALYGAFNQFRSAYGGNYHNWGDYRTGFYDNGVQAGRFYKSNLFDNTLLPDDNGCDWGSIYTLINDCNLILKYVPKIEFTKTNDKNFILGNAYFLRSFAYFYIARIWGDAPVLINPYESANQEGMYPERNPVEEVFTQAEMDIEQAVNLISEEIIKGKGTASKETANMLKADIYLWRTRVNGKDALDKANSAIDYVLNSNKYSMSNNYKDVFSDDKNNEILLSIIYDSNEATYNEGFIQPTANVSAAIQNNPVVVQSGTNWYNITKIYSDFLHENSSDSRALVNAADFTYVSGGVEKYYLWIDKYKGSLVSGTRIFDSDYRVYRFAEAILFKAEILNEMGQATQAINQLNKIAKRAYSIDNYYPSTLTKDEVNNIILDERIKEFSTEGKAWFDLIRFGKVFERISSLKGKENRQNILLWPVSYNSINLNGKIKQTVGYE
ncbi:MAG TPA: RagB/SusD family nutrient uptake outer membrane protein [Clostridia bacterium]|nr:RagB/SusD family nutrient uptake outer membrane protein [Clostridia bacterium]